jgi:hypothetical protein
MPEVRHNQVRVIAVDWSGAIHGVKRKIWLAESDGVSVTKLECGRGRDALVEHLITLSAVDPQFVVGLDFAFSFPEWYLRDRGLASALDLWHLAERESEQWLKECSAPFWGRNRVKKTNVEAEFRRTELAVPGITGIRPKSVFQVYGAGAVGTGTLRGLPCLKRLHEAGFSIWPFDPPGWPMVVEIYPRLLTGPIIKSNQAARLNYLVSRGFNIGPEMLAVAASCEDAFDAMVSAISMAQEWERLAALRPTNDPDFQLEGIIWHPGWEETHSVRSGQIPIAAR